MIKRISLDKHSLCYFWFFSIIIIECLISFSVLPSFFRYISDFINLAIFVVSLFFFKNNSKAYRIILIGLLLMLFYSAASALFVRINLINFIWGMRSFFSPLLFLLNVLFLLNKTDLKRTIHFIHFLFFLNFAMSVVEFALGFINDNNGGIFGIATGCNTGQNILLVTVCILYLHLFNTKQLNLPFLILSFSLCLLISIFAELKIFFFELPIILACYIFGTRLSIGKIAAFLFAVLFIIIFYNVSISINSSFAGNWSIEYIISYLTNERGYTSSGDINRLNGISILSSTLFDHNPLRICFGVGLGMASPSSISFVDTSYYNTYSYLHYNWFTYSYIFVETGIVGLILYSSLLLIVFILLFKSKNYRFISICFLAFIILIMFYNDSLISFRNLVPLYLLVGTVLQGLYPKEKEYDYNKEGIKKNLEIRKRVVF